MAAGDRPIRRISELNALVSAASDDKLLVFDVSDGLRAKTLEIGDLSVAGGGEGITTEQAVDAVAAALTNGANITVTYNDAANTITIAVTGLGSLATLSTVGTSQLTNDAVTADKLANMAQNTIKGRITASTGNPEDLTAANVRTIINVEDGATADMTGAEIHAAAQTINAQTGTTYTIVLTDVGKLVTLSNSSAITVTLPQDSSVAVPIGTRIDFAVLNTGMATFAAGSGATVNPTSPATRAQYSAATAYKRAANTWLVVGDLA